MSYPVFSPGKESDPRSAETIFREEIRLRVHDHHFITAENVWLAFLVALDDLGEEANQRKLGAKMRDHYERSLKQGIHRAVVETMGLEIIP